LKSSIHDYEIRLRKDRRGFGYDLRCGANVVLDCRMGNDAARMSSIMKNPRFPALSFFSALLIGIGWTLIVIGILVLAFCAISLFSSSAADFGAVLTTAMTFGLVGLALVLVGLFTVTVGVSVRVFLAIEAKTHAWTALVKRPK